MKKCKDHIFVGIDISKSFFDVCFLDGQGQLVQQRINQNPKGYRHLAIAISQDAVCVMEATSTYHLPLALWLHNHGIQVVRNDPARYHQQGYGNEGNQKYVSSDGYHEVVYDTDGNIVTDPANMGTYNFASPTGDPLGHLWDDMIPYYLWGNSPDDPTPFLNRLFGPKDPCDPGNSTITP